MIQEIEICALDKCLNQNNALLIDVREDDEVEQGMILGAKHIALSSFPEELEQMPKDRNIIFYCRSGSRSLKAARLLEKISTNNLYSLKGGYAAYIEFNVSKTT